MNRDWKYVPFSELFQWTEKSSIKSGEGKTVGKYKLFVCSDTEVKRFDEYLEDKPSLVFGTGGKASCHIVNEPFSYSTDCVVAQPKSNQTVLKFYYYFLRKDRLGALQKTFTGSGLQHSSKKKIDKIVVPIPALNEQERIVARIEELFSQLDDGVETLLKTKALLKVYRQTVLKDAFSACNEKKPIRNVSSLVTSGSRGWAAFYAESGARFIRITDLTRTGIKLKNNNIQHVQLPEKAEGKRSRLQCGDVLVSITADLGSIALIPEKIGEAYINQHIAMIRFNNPEQGRFMALYLRSEWGQKDLLKNKRGGGKLGLGLDDIRDTPVPIVDNEEANKIIAFIDSRLSACDSIEQTIDTALQQAEAMRQSILKKAFEGTL